MELSGLNVSIYMIELYALIAVILLFAYFMFKIFYVRKKLKIQEVSYRELYCYYEEISAQLLVLLKEFQEQKKRQAKEQSQKTRIYDALTNAYDIQTTYYSVKKGELSQFLYSKLKAVNEITEYLCSLDYFNVNIKDVMKRFDYLRGEIFIHAQSITQKYAETNKRNNEELFIQLHLEIVQILQDNTHNSKAERILSKIQIAVGVSTKISIETYFDITGRVRDKYKNSISSFESLIRNGELNEAAIILLRTGERKNEVLQLMSQINDMEISEINQSRTPENARIEKTRLIKSLQKLNDLINRKIAKQKTTKQARYI